MKPFGFIVVVLGLTLMADVWEFGARNNLPAAKTIALLLAVLLVVGYSYITARSASSLLSALAWPAGAAAASGFFLALFSGMRTQWGAACNGCDPILGLVLWPVAASLAAAAFALPFGWYYVRRSRRAAV